MRFFFIQLFIVLFAITPGKASEKTPTTLTQKDFAHMIISGFGWAHGLPEAPIDRDYFVILGGKRDFRFEAENVFSSQTDNVTTRNFELFGPFTGKEWLMGISQPTTAHFNFLLPIAGEYNIRAVVKGEDFIWNIGNEKRAGGTPSSVFAEVDFGKIALVPGMLKADLTIPAEGGIDSFRLVASDHKPIQPFGGWRFREPLTARDMAEVGVALMNLYEQLPEDQNNPSRQITAVDVALPNKDIAPSKIPFLGNFASQTWLRANHRGATVEIPVKFDRPGFYAIHARLLGEALNGNINGATFSVAGKPYLEMLNLGVHRIVAGDNMVQIELPPMGGIDMLEFTPKNIAASAVITLAGVTGPPERNVSPNEALKYITRIKEKYPVRR